MQLVYSNNVCSAFLAEIVRSFQKYYPSGYLGRTAMQKLAYFSQVTGVPLPCSFEIYNYGPYSDQVTFTVDSMLADEVLADVSLNPVKYSSYKLSQNAAEFSPELQQQVEPFKDQINSVVKVMGKFDPSCLELIATLHFIHRRQLSISGVPPSKEMVLGDFFRVKGAKFQQEEVSSWYDALQSAKLI